MKEKNDLLFTYLDSIETPELASNFKIKKFPSLNEYAENYLANLDKKKVNNNDINSISNDNYNDNNSSVKIFSNDISITETNIQTNQISKINNDKYTSNKYEETNDIEKPFNNQLKTRNNVSIEHLKWNFNNKTKKSETLSKLSNLTFKTSYQKIIFPTNNYKKNNGFSKLYKKISPPNRTKLNSPLFSAFKSSNSKNSNSNNNKLYKYNNYNMDYLNSKSFLSEKGNIDINLKDNTFNKKYSESYLGKKKLLNYINSDRNKFQKDFKKNNTSYKNKLKSNFSESHTDESFIPLISISNRYNTNKSNKSTSLSIENYWKKKEIKKQLKIQKIRKEKINKEISEIRDKPEIDENSRRIVEKLGYNSSSNVFDRLTEFARNHLILNERTMKGKTVDNIYKVNLYKDNNYHNYIERNRKGLENEKAFKSLKQIQNINKSIFDKINQKNEKRKKIDKINLNKYINKKDNIKNKTINKENTNIIILNKSNTKKLKYNSNIDDDNNLENNRLYENKRNIKSKVEKPRIMYKKIDPNINSRKSKKENKSSTNIQNNVKYFNKKINFNNNKDKFIHINKTDKLIFRNTITTNYISNKHIYDHNYSFNKNKIENIHSIKNRTKKYMLKKNQNYKSQQNINDVNNFLNKSQKSQKINKLNTRFINSKKELNSLIIYDNKNKNSNTNLNKSNNVIFLNNKKNNNKNENNNNISNKQSFILNNNKRVGTNKLFIKNTNNSYLMKLDNNNINNINTNDIDTTIYFNIPTKKKLDQDKNYINKYHDYYQNTKKENYNDKKNPISIKKRIIEIKDNDINKYQFIGTENNYINNNFHDNYINIPSYINEEQINNIKKRKLELLKFLDFSSNIGANYNKNNS